MNTHVRLNQKEIEILKETIYKVFGKSEIRIFGSRVDPYKKGGDVDIFVIPFDRNNLYSKKIKAKILLEENLWRNVDIVVHQDSNSKVEKEAIKGVKI